MNKVDVLTTFLQVILSEAEASGFSMRKIILIKYLYLLDVYMAQETGKKYTDFVWSFYKFGPWDKSVNDFINCLIERKLIITEKYESRFNDDGFSILKSAQNPPSRATLWRTCQIPHIVLTKIFKTDMERFKDDTYKLLDYVYFDTQPMQNAKMNDILVFDNLFKDLVYAPKDTGVISKTKSKLIKKLFNQTKEKTTIKKEYFPILNDNLDEQLGKMFFDESGTMENVHGMTVIK